MIALNYNGKNRHLGIELEFYGLNPDHASKIIAKFFKVDPILKNKDLAEIETPLGKFRVETDAVFLKKWSSEPKNESSEIVSYFKDLFSNFTAEFVPTELVTPPLEISDITKVIELQKLLRLAGAKGTNESVRFAFGAQLNPELTSMEPESILNHLKAFVILSDWLKDQIKIDLTRKVTFFAADFPRDYLKMIFQPDYKPNMELLIDDYLIFNPTRNRSLDMLQLFSFIDEKKVRAVVPHQKLRPRPTFHYRLPNCQISMKSWDIGIEWKRWLLVEKLANDSENLKVLSDHLYNELFKKTNTFDNEWIIELNNYVENFR